MRGSLRLLAKQAAIALTAALVALPAFAQTDAVKQELGAFFNVYLGRSLSQAELDRVTGEFQASFGDAQTCDAACRKALANLGFSRSTLAQSPGSPEALMIRHAHIAATWFDPRDRGTLLRKLLVEPDPVFVAHWGSRRLMTQRDLDAILYLDELSNTGKLPRSGRIDSAKRARAITLLKRFEAKGMPPLPLSTVIAAELRSGIERHWSGLSPAKRKQVVNYLKQGAKAPMPGALYSQLLGVSPKEGQRLAAAETAAAAPRPARARSGGGLSSSTLSRYLGLMGAATTTGIIVNGSVGVGR
ncbi:hypothetical protein ACUSIJ_29010 [Pseudochelatococcus sp. B33]